MWDQTQHGVENLFGAVRVLSDRLLKCSVVEPNEDVALPVDLLQGKRLGSDGSFIHFPYGSQVDLVGLLFQPDVVKPEVVIVLIFFQLSLYLLPALSDEDFLHRFILSKLPLEVKVGLLDFVLPIDW